MRKLATTLACGAILLLGALPANAQTGVVAKLSGVANGQTVSGSVTITGSASATTGVDTIKILINNSTVKSQSYGGVQQNASTSFGWNTDSYNNGEYNVKVTATSKGGGNDSASARVLIDNAPATVTGLVASQSDGTVTLGWNPNPESDLIGYRVTRDGNYLGQTSATSMTDRPGSGDHSYSVVAVRQSPTQSEGKTGGAASTSVNVPAAAASDGGSSGSGSGAGSGKAGSVPGYGGSGGGQKGSKDSRGNSGAPAGYGGSFTIGGKSLSGIGLPSNLTLPGPRLNPGSGNIAGTSDDVFEETLPYDLDERNGQLRTESLGGDNIAARSPWRVIPPDGLRWVAAGLWFLVTAALLRFLERKVAEREEAGKASGTAELAVVKDEAA